MKARRRKELRANELIHSLQELVQLGRRYSNHLLVGLIAAALAIGLGGYWRYAKAQRTEQGWAELVLAGQAGGSQGRLEHLHALAETHKDGMLGATARQLLGDALLDEAMYGSGEADPGRRAVLLAQAQAVYQEIVQQYGDRLVPLGVALSGLATIAQERGEWEEARHWYQAILDDAKFGGTPYKSVAEQGLAALPQLAEPVAFAAAPLATQPTTTGVAAVEAESASSQPGQEGNED
jgi:hypothetical protein